MNAQKAHPRIAFGSSEVRARLALSLFVASLVPVVAMDLAVMSVDLANATARTIEAVVIGSGVAGALVGSILGWTLSGVVVRYADGRVSEATGRLVELTHDLAIERDRVARAVEGSQLAMWELDVPSGVTHLSANWSVLMGGANCETTVPMADLLGRVPAADQGPCWSALRAVLRGQSQFYDVEHRVRTDDGTIIWIHSRGAVSSRDANGRVRRMAGTNHDITAVKVAQLLLKESEAKLRLIAENLPLMVTYLDADFRYVFANEPYLEFFGKRRAEVLGRRLSEVAGEDADSVVRERLPDLRAGRAVTFERDRVSRNGELRHYEIRVVPQRDEGEKLVGMFTVIHDVTERAVAARLFQQMALSDPLTGLPNKRLLLDRLERAITQRGRRAGGVALLFVDLDGFKAINDDHGHASGDTVLQEVAGRLRACARASDTVARIGGDEFVALLEDCHSIDDARAVAQKISGALRESFGVNGSARASLSCSVGIAFHPANGETADELLSYADAAMYRAKKAGKNCVVS
jgi:diguanylate cyclase (GGDEF)-like protein/PAS domain S-box-containing protein